MRVMQQENATFLLLRHVTHFNGVAVEEYTVQINSANAQNCETPSNLQITTSTHSAALTWDVNSSYNSFVVEYGPTGFTLGTGNYFACNR